MQLQIFPSFSKIQNGVTFVRTLTLILASSKNLQQDQKTLEKSRKKRKKNGETGGG